MRIVLLRSAVKDLARGYEFYEEQGEGIGDYFEESLAADIESLRLFAGIHVTVHGYHRMLSTKFPYAVYYDGADWGQTPSGLPLWRFGRWIGYGSGMRRAFIEF